MRLSCKRTLNAVIKECRSVDIIVFNSSFRFRFTYIVFWTYHNILYRYRCKAVAELWVVPHSVIRRTRNIPLEVLLFAWTHCHWQPVWYFWTCLRHTMMHTRVSSKYNNNDIFFLQKKIIICMYINARDYIDYINVLQTPLAFPFKKFQYVFSKMINYSNYIY